MLLWKSVSPRIFWWNSRETMSWRSSPLGDVGGLGQLRGICQALFQQRAAMSSLCHSGNSSELAIDYWSAFQENGRNWYHECEAFDHTNFEPYVEFRHKMCVIRLHTCKPDPRPGTLCSEQNVKVWRLKSDWHGHSRLLVESCAICIHGDTRKWMVSWNILLKMDDLEVFPL